MKTSPVKKQLRTELRDVKELHRQNHRERREIDAEWLRETRRMTHHFAKMAKANRATGEKLARRKSILEGRLNSQH